MADVNIVAIIVALLGSGGLAAVITSIKSSVTMHKQGVAGKEDDRREDIMKQRDDALAHARMAEAAERSEEARADAEREQRISWQEESARLRLKLIQEGHDPGPRPKFTSKSKE